MMKFPMPMMLMIAIADACPLCSCEISWGPYNNPHDSANRNADVISSSLLSSPRGLARDSSGNLFVANGGNSTVVRMDTSGVFTAIADTGRPGYAGDGGPATSATLNLPTGLASSPSGELYIIDTGSNVIRKIDSSGNISTVAGQGSLNAPSYLAFGQFGSLFLSDTGNNQIKEINGNSIYIIAGAGTDYNTVDTHTLPPFIIQVE